MKKLYPIIKIPKPIDQNRHTLVMEEIFGTKLYKTKLTDPRYYLKLIFKEIQKLYNNDIIHGDLSEYNIFVSDNEILIIDWPQYVTTEHVNALEILEMDVKNIVHYFYRKYNINSNITNILNYIINIK